MNKKIIIQDINRKRIPFCDLKKKLFIDDDIKLINTLIEVVKIGIDSLNSSIIRTNFMYIIYSLQYLKILKSKYPEVSKIDSCIEEWKQKLKNILNDKKVKKNKIYSSFIKDILEQLEYLLPNNIDEQKENTKELTFQKFINEIIKNASEVDIERLNQLIPISIDKYLSMDKENESIRWNEIKQMIYSLQDKLTGEKDEHKKVVINKIVENLNSYYSEYYDSAIKKYTELFQNYIDINYNEELNQFNCWNIQNGVEENQPFILTIDEPYSLDLDDAIAVSKDGYGMTPHVYIANTTPFWLRNPEYENVAFEKYSSLYFYQKAYHMLPQECAENYLSLIENQIRSVIDHTFYLDHLGNVSYNISYKNIIVNKRLSYDEVNEMIKNKSESNMKEYLATIEKCIQVIYKKTKLDKKYKFMEESRAQKIVASATILVNHTTTIEAIKNKYLLLYQDYSSGKFSVSAPENVYAKVTSPIRRYSDLKNNYLLNRFLEGNISDIEYYTIEKELQDMIPKLEERKERNKQFSKLQTLHVNHKI